MALVDTCSFNTAVFEALWMFYKVEVMQSVAVQSHGWCMMGTDMTCSQRWPGLSSVLCSRIVGLMLFHTGWRGRSSPGFSSTLCRKIRIPPLLSEPGSCLPLSQQPLGRWQGDGWYLQPGRTAPHARTHSQSVWVWEYLSNTPLLVAFGNKTNILHIKGNGNLTSENHENCRIPSLFAYME